MLTSDKQLTGTPPGVENFLNVFKDEGIVIILTICCY